MKKNKDKGKPCLIRDSARQLQGLPGINSRRKNKPLLDPYIDDEDDQDDNDADNNDEDDSNNDDGGAIDDDYDDEGGFYLRLPQPSVPKASSSRDPHTL